VLAERNGQPARLSDIAAELGAPRSSVHALLRTLTDANWVKTDPSGTFYSLGLRSLLVGASFIEADPYARVVRPVLADLRDELRETVHMARLDADRVIYLITHESGHESRKFSRIGRFLPAHATSLGKAVLAERGETPSGPFAKLTPHTLTTAKALAADLRQTRERGYATDAEEGTAGIRCVGVALRYTTPTMDAISCSLPTSRMTPAREQEVAAALLRARDQIEESAPLPGTV
jgi:DNA-binding IclR family transcriptional regulator